MNIVYNMDCMEGMKRYPDGYFDLAVVDPVYGDVPYGGYMSNSGGGIAGHKDYHNAIWEQDKTGKEYFNELFRVSKNQIIWGGNYFVEEIGRNSPCWVVWDKDHPAGVHYADCELAWTSFYRAARLFRYRWNGFIQQNMKNREVRIHPTQKPTDLYRWLTGLLMCSLGPRCWILTWVVEPTVVLLMTLDLILWALKWIRHTSTCRKRHFRSTRHR